MPEGASFFIDDIAFRVLRCTTEGIEAIREDGLGLVFFFPGSEIANYNKSGRLYYKRSNAAATLPADPEVHLSQCLSGLREPEARALMGKLIQIEAYRELMGDPNFKPSKLTVTKFRDAMRPIVARNCEAAAFGGRRAYAARFVQVPQIVSQRQIQRYCEMYAEHGLAGLLSHTKNRGNHGSDLPASVLEAVHHRVRGYLNTKQESIKTLYGRLESDIDQINTERLRNGEPPFKCPCPETFRKYINILDPFSVDFYRRGLAYALRKHKPIGDAPKASRPLEIVEIDEWHLDVILLLNELGVWDKLSKEQKKQLGLEKNEVRWWITAAIDIYSRCIVAMRLSPTPSAQIARSVVEMVTQDKGQLTDAVGTLTPWCVFGTPLEIRTDNASWYCSDEFRLPLADLGVIFNRPAAGNPWLKPYIESWFGVVGKVLADRLSGKTFSDIKKRGDFDSEADAALTIDDFTDIIIHWVFDAYHNAPHRGLLGKTPIQVWLEGVAEFGVEMGPCLQRRRMIFGERMTKKVHNYGIEILGVRYQSEQLQQWLRHARQKEARIRWHPDDIGAILVELDDEWVEVSAAQEEYFGVSADTWRSTLRYLRADNSRKQVVSRSTLRSALAKIDEINAAARKRAKLTVDDWSQEAMDRFEKRFTIGFSVAADRKPRADGGMFVDTYERGSPPAVGISKAVPSPSAPAQSEPERSTPSPAQKRSQKREAPKPFTGGDDESGGLA
jgi:putative transposase